MASAVKRSYDDNSGDSQAVKREKTEKTDNRTRVKFLVPVYTAGAIIGAKGAEILKLKNETNTQVHLSEAQEFFPGTRERVVVVTGMEGDVVEVFKRINNTLRTEEIPQKESERGDRAEKRRKTMKCLVPASIAGKIVGRKGETVTKMQNEHCVKIDVTPSSKAIPGLDERGVDISGESDNVVSCGEEVLRLLTEEPDKRMSSNLVYSTFNMAAGGGYNPGGYNQQGGYQQGGAGYQQAGYGGQGGYGGYGQQGSYPPQGGYPPQPPAPYQQGGYGPKPGYGGYDGTGYGQQSNYGGYDGSGYSTGARGGRGGGRGGRGRS